MFKKISGSLLVAALLSLCSGLSAGAQTYGSYTPYSIYGIGDLSNPGSAYNKSMGGVGIASRNNRFLNIVNPAAVTARDSLAFMADFSLYGDNKIFKQDKTTSASNTFNINDIAMSFPIQRASAMMVGVQPFSDTGFGFSYDFDDPSVIGITENITYAATGSGSIYKGFAAAGVTFLKRLSIGVEADYYFGMTRKGFAYSFSNASFNSISNSTELQVSGWGGKFGLQYEQPLGSMYTLGVGATYSTGAKMKGYFTDARFSSGSAASDTLYYRADTLGKTRDARIAGEIGVGVSLRYGDKWRVEFDYTRSDWTECGLNSISGFNPTSTGITSIFGPAVAETFRIGAELVPNRNDIRYYFNRVAYRAGAYYKKDYFTLEGKGISSKGLTFGATLPINRYYNGLTLGMEIGERSAIANNQIKERFINFSIGINIFDIWFQKTQYD